jgi:transcription elongation factor GreA
MGKQGQSLSLGEAAVSFLTTLLPQEREDSSREVNKFVLWYGKEKSLNQLTPVMVGSYAEWIAASALDAPSKLEPVKKFLSYAKKEGLIKANLATHLRSKKTPSKIPMPARRGSKQIFGVSSHSYTQLKTRIAALEVERQKAIEERHRAAADKDFRENAPLQAAKERQEHVEAQIREIDSTLKSAAFVREKSENTLKVRPGCRVILGDLSSGEKLNYTMVNPSEVRLVRDVLSIASPIGKALLNHCEGDIVEVTAPIGKLCYHIDRIELPGKQT